MAGIGLLGGTYDPIHIGHLDVARAALNALQLDEVLLAPAAVPPHRRPPIASAADRLAMVAAAVDSDPRLRASDLDMQSDAPSYTCATLDRLEAAGQDLRTVVFITGADAFRDIATWKDYPGILDRCHFAVVSRPGCPVGELRARLPDLAGRMIDGGQVLPEGPAIVLIDAPTAPVSSTSVRRRIAAGEPVEDLMPGPVAAYIRNKRLYE